jgi:hypothetical protein
VDGEFFVEEISTRRFFSGFSLLLRKPLPVNCIRAAVTGYTINMASPKL